VTNYPPLGTVVFTRPRGNSHVKDWEDISTAACVVMCDDSIGIVYLRTGNPDFGTRRLPFYFCAPQDMYATQDEANAAGVHADEAAAAKAYERAREASARYANEPCNKDKWRRQTQPKGPVSSP
jgi:hypothetical protein